LFKYYTSYALVLTGLTHLICCGFPFILSISSVFTNLFVFQSLALSFVLEVFESYLFIFTTLIFLTLISIEIYNKKIKCTKDNKCCVEEQCDLTKKKIKFNIIFSTILYVFNSYIFLSEIIFK